MENLKIYFITGVCGTGKTTVLKVLKELLPKNSFDLHDLDERGIPKNAGREWRINETKYLISVGEDNLKKGLSTVVSGFSRPSEVKDLIPTLDNVFFILLDANAETIKNRIFNRYPDEKSKKQFEDKHGKSVYKFIEENINFSETMRKEAYEYESKIIDTNNKNPDEIGQEILGLISLLSLL